jgi:hypothetical protein
MVSLLFYLLSVIPFNFVSLFVICRNAPTWKLGIFVRSAEKLGKKYKVKCVRCAKKKIAYVRDYDGTSDLVAHLKSHHAHDTDVHDFLSSIIEQKQQQKEEKAHENSALIEVRTCYCFLFVYIVSLCP